MEQRTLLVMRLADMRLVHPQMDHTHVCAHCGEAVGIFPAGQDVLRQHPDAAIICQVCFPEMPPASRVEIAPGALEEISEVVPKV